MEVVLGDDTVVSAVGRGTVFFERESMQPMFLKDVLFVPGLKKNLVSVSMIEIEASVYMSLMGKFTSFPSQQVHLNNERLESGVGNYTSFFSSNIMHCHTLKTVMSCVSYSTEGWLIFTIQLCGC